jgi:glycerophosphoryl diester phosphodiesterase
LRERDLTARAMVSTMEVPSLEAARELDHHLRLGWTYPPAPRAWDRKRWARPALLGAVAAMRRRLPSLARRRAPALGVWAMWVYHPLITPRLATACHEAGIDLIAWTVDELDRMRELHAAGVDGIVTNDPRLLAELGAPRRATRAAPTRSPLAAAPPTPGRPR